MSGNLGRNLTNNIHITHNIFNFCLSKGPDSCSSFSTNCFKKSTRELREDADLWQRRSECTAKIRRLGASRPTQSSQGSLRIMYGIHPERKQLFIYCFLGETKLTQILDLLLLGKKIVSIRQHGQDLFVNAHVGNHSCTKACKVLHQEFYMFFYLVMIWFGHPTRSGLKF